MKRKIYITVLLLSTMTLGYAAFSLLVKKVTPTPVVVINQEEETLKFNANVADTILPLSLPEGIKDDLLKINKAHAALDNIKITNHYTRVSTLMDNKEKVDESQFSLYRKGAKLFYDAGSIKRIQNEKYNVLINQDLHMILLFDPDKSFGWYMKEALKNFNPDSSLRFADKAVELSADKGNKAYSIYYSMLPYNRMDIDFNETTNLLNHITFYMNNYEWDDDIKKQKLTINMNYQNLAANSKDLFDMRKYFTRSKDEIKPSESYAGYELYNNMKK